MVENRITAGWQDSGTGFSRQAAAPQNLLPGKWRGPGRESRGADCTALLPQNLQISRRGNGIRGGPDSAWDGTMGGPFAGWWPERRVLLQEMSRAPAFGDTMAGRVQGVRAGRKQAGRREEKRRERRRGEMT